MRRAAEAGMPRAAGLAAVLVVLAGLALAVTGSGASSASFVQLERRIRALAPHSSSFIQSLDVEEPNADVVVKVRTPSTQVSVQQQRAQKNPKQAREGTEGKDAKSLDPHNVEQRPLDHQATIRPDAYPNVQPFLYLVYEYPKVQNAARQAEFTKALQTNIDHPLVKQFHLFVQPDAKEFLAKEAGIRDPHQKIVLWDLKRQIKYSQLFTHVNIHLQKQVVVVMNADIEIGEGWDLLTIRPFKANGKDVAFALSRYQRAECGDYATFCFGDGGGRNKGDYVPDRHIKDYLTSHDAFCMVPPVPEGVIRSTRFKQNIPTAENRVVNAFRDAGWDVINPCLTLKTWHEHCSEMRKWGSPMKDWAPVRNGVAKPQVLPQ